jgi:hypothetical protein
VNASKSIAALAAAETCFSSWPLPLQETLL